jgi:hypothetical protein
MTLIDGLVIGPRPAGTVSVAARLPEPEPVRNGLSLKRNPTQANPVILMRSLVMVAVTLVMLDMVKHSRESNHEYHSAHNLH